MLLELNNVNYVYNEGTVYEKHAVKNISLSIDENEFVAVIGHTGSGKSTLIQMFNGLIKPSSGTVCYRGENINEKDYNRRALCGKVGLVFQYPEHQLFEQTIIKDVCFGPKNQGLTEEEVLERAKWALGLVGIDEELFEDSPFDLSGGQKKRVALAGILAMKPEVLVLDEPAAGLDPGYKKQIFDAIKRIHEEEHISVVLISHSMEDVAEYAERVIVLNDGEKIFDDTAGNVFSHVEELESMGLSVPWVSKFAAALSKEGLDIRRDIITVDECVEALKRLL